jgi:hypothetical protein
MYEKCMTWMDIIYIYFKSFVHLYQLISMMIFFRFLVVSLLINTLSSRDPWTAPQSTSFHHVLELIHARAKISHPLPSSPFTLSSLLPFVINDTTCRNDLILLMHGLRNEDKWALKIIDSWGVKPPAGILEGSHLWLGSYDECLHPLYLPTNRSHAKQPYLTKYCTISTQETDNDQVFLQKPALIMGICLPKSCHSTDIQSKFVFETKYRLPLFMRFDPLDLYTSNVHLNTDIFPMVQYLLSV